MKQQQAKRKVRTYKVLDVYYSKAQKICAQTDKSLAERIEDLVVEISKCKKINTIPNNITAPSWVTDHNNKFR